MVVVTLDDDRSAREPRERDRAQTFTLEAVVAAILLIAGIAFALQVTGVTSQSSSTASEHVSNEHAERAAGALDAAAANGTLRQTVLYWNVSTGSFHDSNQLGYYEDDGPPTAFWQTLTETFDERGLAINVNVIYLDNGTTQRKRVVHQGEPSDEAGRATITLTLYDDDRLYDRNGTLSSTTVLEARNQTQPRQFYAPDVSDGPIYTVVRVEVVVWRV